MHHEQSGKQTRSRNSNHSSGISEEQTNHWAHICCKNGNRKNHQITIRKRLIFSISEDLLCKKNISSIDQQSTSGVYMIPCSCGRQYVGEARATIKTRLKKHQKAWKQKEWFCFCRVHSIGRQYYTSLLLNVSFWKKVFVDPYLGIQRQGKISCLSWLHFCLTFDFLFSHAQLRIL